MHTPTKEGPGHLFVTRTVLDLHDLVAPHVTSLDEAEWVIHAQRREHANVALREHLRSCTDRLGRKRCLEGGDGLEERKGSDGFHHFEVCAQMCSGLVD